MLKMRLRKISKKRIVIMASIALLFSFSAFSLYKLFAAKVNPEDYHVSQVIGDTVYVNDLEADWGYYQGLNFTNITNDDLPSGLSQNLYTEDTLVPVTVTYDATSAMDSSLVGKV